MARSGNTLYIAGSFRSVGENSGGHVPFDARTGDALRPFPKVAGSVYVSVPDGKGGWYIGGDFAAVDGKPRSCLAQIRADGSVSDWDPKVSGSPEYIDPPAVSAIAVRDDHVYVAGGFQGIGGVPRLNLGCVDRQSGAVLDWSADTRGAAWVYALAIHEGTLFVGGAFDTLGGQPRGNLAAVDMASGVVTPWRADVVGWVNALLVREDTLYVGGTFLGINFQDRPMLAAVVIPTGQLLPFDAHAMGVVVDYYPPPEVRAMVLVGDTLYVAGSFTQIGGEIRSSIAALNVATGTALAWAPDTLGPRFAGYPPPLLETLAVGGGMVYVGGWFETVEGQSRPYLAALSAETGHVTEWNPKPDLAVYALAVHGDTVHAGGLFHTVGDWKHRAGLAAIDLTTGVLKPWNPNPDGVICTAIAIRGDRVLVSGDFASIGGQPQPRHYFAALDTINGEVLDWDPGAGDIANVFLLVDDTLYVGGEFRQMGGQIRNYAAAVSATTGEVLPWNPNANWPVLALARSGNTMYVGGLFDRIRGQIRPSIAAVDATTGAVALWNPGTDGLVEALLVDGNKVYVGGGFTQIGRQARESLAAVDATTAKPTPWDPRPTPWGIRPRVWSLALAGGKLYAGGVFGSIGEQPRICLAEVDTTTGLATNWDPGLDGLVWSLKVEGNTLYVGGGFARAGGLPAAGLAAFTLPQKAAPVPRSFTLAQCVPNPARSSATIQFALPAAATVTLSVYDLQGRRIASLLDHAVEDAGPHDVPVRTDGWKPGVYLYRLDAGPWSATRKMVVVRGR
jgi:hypothetical protein